MNSNLSIVWFRRDLRLADNPALHAAIQSGGNILPLYVLSTNDKNPWQMGSASKYWLHQSLLALNIQLHKLGSRLILRKGNPLPILKDLIHTTHAQSLFFNRLYEPHSLHQDTLITSELQKMGTHVETFNSSLLFEPWDIQNKQGNPFQVFTPFWKTCLQKANFELPLPSPSKLPTVDKTIPSLPLVDFQLEPKINWTNGIKVSWKPGELNALNQLQSFLEERMISYPVDRDIPARVGTSRLSPYLHFGEISPRQIWTTVNEDEFKDRRPGIIKGAEGYLRQMGWREFSHHLLYHFPHTTEKPLRLEFEKFPWLHNPESLQAWQKGNTGYPIVDAGMRELWETGWMHNRVRMIVGSFLVKDLLIPWQEGAHWFWDTLVDADLANNTLGWQWVSGCGADAAPYFRIFNPVLQGEKVDLHGNYVKKWCPELSSLPHEFIHHPWDTPPDLLKKTGVNLGNNYPNPIVNHSLARIRALKALSRISKKKLSTYPQNLSQQ